MYVSPLPVKCVSLGRTGAEFAAVGQAPAGNRVSRKEKAPRVWGAWLSAKTERAHDGAVAVHILAVQVSEQASPSANEFDEAPTAGVVEPVRAQMIGQL